MSCGQITKNDFDPFWWAFKVQNDLIVDVFYKRIEKHSLEIIFEVGVVKAKWIFQKEIDQKDVRIK